MEVKKDWLSGVLKVLLCFSFVYLWVMALVYVKKSYCGIPGAAVFLIAALLDGILVWCVWKKKKLKSDQTTTIKTENICLLSMLNVGKTHDTLKVVSDQVGTPTYTYDLARLLVDMIETDKYGYYHVTNEGGYISWYDFTKEIFRQAVELGHTEYSEDRLTVLPVTTAEYGLSKAKRPFNSRLDKSKLVKNGFTPLPTWQDALRRYLKEIGM